jgi:hypothetical protein
MAATTSPPETGVVKPIEDAPGCQPAGSQVAPQGDPGPATPDPTDVKRAVAEWAESSYAPLDSGALDPPSVCERCQQPIAPDDPVDYLTGEDGSVAIVHESCPDPAPRGRD